MDSREGRLRGWSWRVAVTNQAMPHAAAGRPGDNRGLFLETGERRGWTVDYTYFNESGHYLNLEAQWTAFASCFLHQFRAR